MSQLFISHANEDHALAAEIGGALEAKGFSVWYYERDGLPGLNYARQIIKALAECESVLLIISPVSMESHQIDAEIWRAFEINKSFVPVLKGVSYDELEERRPEWTMALRAATAIAIPSTGVSAILPQLEKGLRLLGLKPTDEASHAAAPVKLDRKAYICYASADRIEVLRRVQALSLSGISIMMDSLDIKPSHSWESWVSQLYRRIDEADVFFLFWSEAAARSEWVEREVQYVLRRKGGDLDSPPEIVPIVLSANAPPPPESLASLHFNDKFLYYINAEEMLKKPPPAKPPQGSSEE
jgi:TIR domain-containing protein